MTDKLIITLAEKLHLMDEIAELRTQLSKKNEKWNRRKIRAQKNRMAHLRKIIRGVREQEGWMKIRWEADVTTRDAEIARLKKENEILGERNRDLMKKLEKYETEPAEPLQEALAKKMVAASPETCVILTKALAKPIYLKRLPDYAAKKLLHKLEDYEARNPTEPMKIRKQLWKSDYTVPYSGKMEMWHELTSEEQKRRIANFHKVRGAEKREVAEEEVKAKRMKVE